MFSRCNNYKTTLWKVKRRQCLTFDRRFSIRRETIYQTSDQIDFTTNWYESIPIQILRSKIFIPIIDEQWYSSFWCSWMLLFALVTLKNDIELLKFDSMLLGTSKSSQFTIDYAGDFAVVRRTSIGNVNNSTNKKLQSDGDVKWSTLSIIFSFHFTSICSARTDWRITRIVVQIDRFNNSHARMAFTKSTIKTLRRQSTSIDVQWKSIS